MTPHAPKPRFDLPHLGVGVGLRTQHFADVLAQTRAAEPKSKSVAKGPARAPRTPRPDWFEIISENFMDQGGRPAWILEQVAAEWPIVMHGVSMSIGSTDPIDRDYLAKLKALAKRVNARWVSDHLCWTGVASRNMHDLLPVPYTEECLRHVIARVEQVQDVLERPLVLENPSSYVEFKSSTMSEWEFLSRLAEEADCGLLLDVNNVYVSSFNHRFDPNEYIDAIPPERVVQFHVAGHSNKGTHILDTHSDHAIAEVWELFGRACERTGGRSTLYEWDEDIPAFDVLVAEADKARAYAGMGRKSAPVAKASRAV